MGIMNTIQGTLSPDEIAKIMAGIKAPDASAYQIQGIPEYQNSMGGLANEYGTADAAQQQGLAGFPQQFADMGANAAQQYGVLGSQYGTAGSTNQAALQGIQQNVANLYGQIPGAPNLSQVTADPMAQLQQLRDYQMGVAQGTQTTAADQMLQNAQARQGSQLQSALVSNRGMNPALAMRQMFQQNAALGGQTAANMASQKFGEQTVGAQQAAGLNNSLYNQQFQNAQQGFQNENTAYGNKMQNQRTQADLANSQFGNQMASTQGQQSTTAAAQQAKMAAAQQQMAAVQQQYQNRVATLNARQNIANGIFNANVRQSTFNQQLAQDRAAYDRFQTMQQLQAAQDQARSKAAIIRAVGSGVLTAGGMAVGSMLPGAGTMIGGVLGSGAANAIFGGGGGGGMDPAMMALMSQSMNRGETPNQPFTYDNGITGADANYAEQMSKQGYVGPSMPSSPNPDYSQLGTGVNTFNMGPDRGIV